MHTHLFTIFTPTLNRAHLLPRLYESIKRQTFKDFIWVVMYGESSDNTEEVLEGFKNEKIIDIQVIKHPNTPPLKHLALKYAFENCKTPYLIDVDDDDELYPETLAIFYKELINIEKEGRNDIGSIRALTITEKGEIGINDKSKMFTKSFDKSFLDTHYYFTPMENLTCYYVEKVCKHPIFNDTSFYLKEYAIFISESIFWGRLSRFYLTRYIPNTLLLVHLTSFSHLRRPKNHQYYINKLINSKIIFEEQNDYLRKKPRLYLRSLIKISLLTCALKKDVRYRELLGHMKHGKTLLVLLFPAATIISFFLFKNKIK